MLTYAWKQDRSSLKPVPPELVRIVFLALLAASGAAIAQDLCSDYMKHTP